MTKRVRNAAKQAIYQKRWYEKNKRRHVANVRVRNVRVKEESSQRLLEYLLEHPCTDCGEADPIVLEFDHVRGKKVRNVATMVNRGHAWHEIEKEMAKCEVRCANCHRRATAKRGNWFRTRRSTK